MRYVGNIIPSKKWTASSSSDRAIKHIKQNSPGLAKSVIKINANSQMNGERFVCTMYFEDPLVPKENAARNAPNCTTLAISSPLTVHCRYYLFYHYTEYESLSII